jgi:hypothetical protein
MLVESSAVTNPRHKNGVALEQRRSGRETLIQWSNGDQMWCDTRDLETSNDQIVLIGAQEYTDA